MAGEFGWGGLGGGPGGIAFPDILTALGQALLSSPRDAPFANLPQTMQVATQAGRQRQSDAAMVSALKQVGYDDATALQLAANPEAAKLAVQAKTLKENTQLLESDPILGRGAAAPASAVPPAVGPRADAGPTLPAFAAIQGQQPSGKIPDMLSGAAGRYGLDPSTLLRTAQLESGFDPIAANPTSSARGLMQFTSGTARQYGLSNPLDPAASADAGARLMRDNAETLRSALGRDPQPWELYLAHQQGAGGALKLLSQPAARAADLVGANAVRLNGGRPDMSAAEFAGLWQRKFGNVPPSWQTAQATPGQFDAQLQQARGATAAGGELPIVAPIPKTPENTQALTTLKQGGYQPPTTTQEAYQQATSLARRIQLYEARGMKVDGLKPFLDHYLKLATPTDLERQIDAAGLQGDERRQALLNAIPNHQPTAIREAEYVTQRPAMRDTVIEMKRAGAPNTVINNAVNPILKGLGEQFVTGADAARASADTIRSVQTARAQIDAPGGVVTGQWANNRLALQKIGSLFGAVDPETIQNTETFRAAIKPIVLETVKGLGAGSGISNTDREFAEKAVGGDITLDERAIRRVLDITERAARSKIERHNTLADKMLQTQPDLQAIAPMLRIEAPPPVGSTPSPGGAPPPLSGTTRSGVPWSARP